MITQRTNRLALNVIHKREAPGVFGNHYWFSEYEYRKDGWFFFAVSNCYPVKLMLFVRTTGAFSAPLVRAMSALTAFTFPRQPAGFCGRMCDTISFYLKSCELRQENPA